VTEVLNAVLATHAEVLGDDLEGYRNHVHRVHALCAALASPTGEQREKIAIAAVFHDLGIWTDGTFDYLEPSVRLVRAHLEAIDRMTWAAEIEEMVRQHHRVRPYRGPSGWLVEPFRRADWIDVSRGLLTLGLTRGVVSGIRSQWPDAGFHWRLVRLAGSWLRTHPSSPLPMLKL
jgi:hypothetical protein